ncbi:MAG: tripartite tricarboxylate transporter substrate-binding protein [Beijerinckiaceae bacterium]|nr:tripartite tricarboxylate transporter substrate-binding protein [Beijerinckiaceae bacterium]
MVKQALLAGCWAAVAFAIPALSKADEVATFYAGNTIRIIVGYDPGGGYDAYARILAPAFGKHIPGSPQVIIQNMPGAGSMKAADFIYNVAPRDGTQLGVFSAATALEPLFGNTSARYETVKFGWIGNMFRDTHACATWKNSGIDDLQQIISSDKEVVFGATGAGSAGNQHALVLKNMLGANIRVINGYKGIRDVGLALQRNEVQVACAMALSTVKSSFPNDYASDDLRMLVQFGKERHPFMKDATHFYDLLRTEEDRQVADLFFGQSAIARPLAGPPDLPTARLAALRSAMTTALKDPGLLSAADKAGADIVPETGEELTTAFSAFYRTPPSVVERAKQIMERK